MKKNAVENDNTAESQIKKLFLNLKPSKAKKIKQKHAK